MAGIREELTLVDRFSAVFDRFINMGNRAVTQAGTVEAATNNMTKAADAAESAYKKIGWNAPTSGADQMINSINDVSRKMMNVGNESSAGMARTAQTFEKATETVNFYKKALADVEKEMDRVSKNLWRAEMMPFGGRSQQKSVDTWRKQSDVLAGESERLKASLSMAEAEAAKLAPAINGAVNPTKAVHNEFKSMVGTVMKITALLGGLYAGKKFIEMGIKTDAYEKMFQSRLGNDELGSAAFQHYKDMANKYGFAQDEVMQGVMSFMGMTTVPKQLDQLMLLSKRLAVFDTQGQGLKGAQFSMQEAMAGNFQSLQRRFSIGHSIIKASGVEAAAKSGDMQKFIDAMEKLFTMRNMGEDAFNKMMQSPKWQINQLEARWNNAMSNMAQTTILRLLPAISQFSEALASPAGEKFFSFLATVIGTAAWAVLELANGFLFLVQILEPFTPILEVIFYTLLITGIARAIIMLYGMAQALAINVALWYSMNLPLLAVIGIIVVLLALFLKFPEVFGIVAGGIAYLAAGIYDFLIGIYNGIKSIINLAITGYNKITGKNTGLLGYTEGIDPVKAFTSGKAWGTEAATKLSDTLSGLKASAMQAVTTPWDNFAGKQMDLPNVGKVGHVGKIHEPVKLNNEDLKMLLDIADRDYINKINTTQLTPEVHVHVDNAGGPVDADGVAERIKHMLIEQAASSTNLAYGG